MINVSCLLIPHRLVFSRRLLRLILLIKSQSLKFTSVFQLQFSNFINVFGGHGHGNLIIFNN